MLHAIIAIGKSKRLFLTVAENSKMKNKIFENEFDANCAQPSLFSKCPTLQVFPAVTIVDGLPAAESED